MHKCMHCHPTTETSKDHNMSNYQWQDPFHLDEQLTADERMIRDAAYEYCQGNLMPCL